MERVTEIQIRPIKAKDGLIAFASFILDNCLYLSSVGIYTKNSGSGFRITYPTRKVGTTSLQIFHPINRDLGICIEEAINKKADELFNE